MSINKIAKIVPSVIASLCLLGCSDDIGMKPDYTRSGEDVEIKVSVTLPSMETQTRANLDEAALNEVNSLWIRTYSADTGKATSDWIVVEDNLPTSDTEVARPVTIRTQSGRSFIVGVANVENEGVTKTSLTPAPLKDLLSEADTWQKFLDIAAVAPSSYQNVRAPQPPLTMAGCYSDLIVGVEPTNISDWQEKNFTSYFIPAQKGVVDLTTHGAIHLRRIVSHVNFKFIPADDLTVTVNSYQVMNAPRFSWLYDRPAENGMEANFGDLAESEDKVMTYFADVPQFNSQFVTENPDDGTSTFDFWQGENKHVGTAATYGDRGQISTPGHFTSLMGDEWSPNNEASYVLVNCTVEYKDPLNVNEEGVMTPGGTEVIRTGEVTYLMHLGAVGGVMTDFNCYRNVNYTYNVTVNGVNDIRVDAYATDEAYHNEEGMVVDITQATIDIDAHYAAFNIEMTQQELEDPNFGFLIITYENGTQYVINDNNNRNGDGSVIYDDKGNVIAEKYYNWIELRPTTDENTLAEYKPRYGGNADGGTFLLSSLTDGWNSIGVDQRSESGWYTVFVNEYTYEPMYTGNDGYADETWNGTGNPAWNSYVNQNPRRFYIRVQQKTSPDGNSVYARSKYGISQQSIMTYYSENAMTADGTAVGVERENETLGMNLRHTFGGGSSVSNGRWNTCQWLQNDENATNLNINSSSADSRPEWFNFIDEETSLYVPAVTGLYAQGGGNIPARYGHMPRPVIMRGIADQNYTFNDPQQSNDYTIEAINACISRNRDNNGNGRIEPDELRWYVPAMDQYLHMMVGSENLPESMIEYSTISSLPHVSNNSYQWANNNATNYRYANDYCSRYMYVSSNSGSSVMWVMEGTSTSEYAKVSEWARTTIRPWQVRCIRNLGSDMTSVQPESKVEHVYVHDETSRTFRMNYFGEAAIRPNAYSGNGNGANQMPIHTIASPYNSVYYGFQYADSDITVSSDNKPDINNFSNTYNRLNTYINSNPCSAIGNSWRVPNQVELTIMRNAGLMTGGGERNMWLSCTVNYFNSTTGVGGNGVDGKYFMVVVPTQGTQYTANNASASDGVEPYVYIRCVRDVNN